MDVGGSPVREAAEDDLDLGAAPVGDRIVWDVNLAIHLTASMTASCSSMK